VVINWTYIGRIIRGQVLSLREKEFIEAARASGARSSTIIFRELLPNLVAPIVVYSTLIIPQNILLEAALSFLGVGISPPRASWGQGASHTLVSSGAKKGGTITVLSNGDVDHIDPGEAYYAFTYQITYVTQRPLLAYKPNSVTPVPDLAASMPTVSKDGKTVTVKLRHGVKFSPPVNREVTSADVKYAIERGFDAAVANGYAGAYFGVIDGAPTKSTNTVP